MSGPTVIVDTNIFVSARNRSERGSDACRAVLERVDQGQLRAVVSTITVAEMRAGLSPEDVSAAWSTLLTHLLTSENFTVAPVDVDIAETAGELRASSRLTLPDALIVATGMRAGAACVVTQDEKLARQQTVLSVRAPQEML